MGFLIFLLRLAPVCQPAGPCSQTRNRTLIILTWSSLLESPLLDIDIALQNKLAMARLELSDKKERRWEATLRKPRALVTLWSQLVGRPQYGKSDYFAKTTKNI